MEVHHPQLAQETVNIFMYSAMQKTWDKILETKTLGRVARNFLQSKRGGKIFFDVAKCHTTALLLVF